MAHFDYDIGVIGGGATDLTVSSGAAQLGAKPLLVEREPSLGGGLPALHFDENDRALAEGCGRGKIKMRLDSSERPLDVQVIGPRAGDLLGEWVAILNGRIKLSTMAGAIHPYPTLAEINKWMVGSYLSPKIFSPTIKRG